MNTITSEAAIVAAAKTGDASCFEELVRRNESRVLRLAFGVTGNQEDAEDAMQESFIKAYHYLDKFRGDSLFSSWLTRIAVNEALMKVRRRRPNHVEFDETNVIPGTLIPNQAGEWGDNPERRFAQAELREILLMAIQKLRPVYRIVFTLRDLESLSNKETAQLLGLKVATVKARILRARLMLRSRLNIHFRNRARKAASLSLARDSYSALNRTLDSGYSRGRFASAARA